MQEATPEKSADRLTAIRARMAAAAKLARRPSEDIQLIADNCRKFNVGSEMFVQVWLQFANIFI